ncbi:chitin deacetylase [Actinomortierella ambigua]|uniref:Chitin deacetylase n=1 Tax=Actinomortierella ambigua TaxID=1343610 RepID=A0A9P6QHH8_9FUNG|nr:chitin deacetylase [Actinomortierella ambigua]
MRPITWTTIAAALAVICLSSPVVGEMPKNQQKKYPPKDEIPNLKSPQMKKWMAEIDWSKVPKIPMSKANRPECPECPEDKKKIPKDSCWWTCGGCVAKDDVEKCPKAKSWGLTYDDGPSEDTPRLLKKLKASNATATFFIVGSRVLEYPELLKQQVREGHHLAIHTWSHQGMTSLSNEEVVAELKWAEQIIFDVTGLKTKYWRPPYGDVDNRVREIARQFGYKTVIWTKEWDSNDWQLPEKTITTKQVYRNFKWALSTLPKLKYGPITLEHDLFESDVNVAHALLDMGIAKGLDPMDIARCLSDDRPYQNSPVKKVDPPKKPALPQLPQSPPPQVAAKPVAAVEEEEAKAPPAAAPPKKVEDEVKPAADNGEIDAQGTKKLGAGIRVQWGASAVAVVVATAAFLL